MMKPHTLNLFQFLIALFCVWLIPDILYAQNPPAPTPPSSSAIAGVLCSVTNVLTGPVGSIIAMLGVVSLGLVAMFGKIQISSVLTILMGIAVIFGAPQILTSMGVGGSCTAGTTIVASQFSLMLGCVLGWFIGPIGKSLATLALITIGFFATYGRVSWHQAMLVAVGMATMFGSASIVASLGVNTANIIMCDVAPPLSIQKVLCTIYNWFNGPIGAGLATVGLVVIGLGALFGKVSWGIAMIYSVGVGIMFGADSIVIAMSGAEGVSARVICYVGDLKAGGVTTPIMRGP